MEEKKPPVNLAVTRQFRTKRVDEALKAGEAPSKKHLIHLLREANIIMTRQAEEIARLKKKRIWLPGMRP